MRCQAENSPAEARSAKAGAVESSAPNQTKQSLNRRWGLQIRFEAQRLFCAAPSPSIARRKQIYEKLHPETRLGANAKAAADARGGNDAGRQNGEAHERFTSATAKATSKKSATENEKAACAGRPFREVQDRVETICSEAHTTSAPKVQIGCIARIAGVPNNRQRLPINERQGCESKNVFHAARRSPAC